MSYLSKLTSKLSNIDNMSLFMAVSSFWYLAIGLLGPFYVIYVQEIGGSVETLGMAFGIMVVAQSVTSIFAGKISDKFGRKPFLLLIGYLNAVIFLAYTMISNLTQLYAIQMVWGMVDAIDVVVTQAFLADMTKKSDRGMKIGKFQTVVGLSRGLSIMIGGYIVGMYGIEIIFYISALSYALSTTALFFLKEDGYNVKM